MMVYIVFGALILLACLYLFRNFRKSLKGGGCGCGCEGCGGCSMCGIGVVEKKEEKKEASSVRRDGK